MGNVPSPRYRRTLQQCQRVEGQSFYSLILPANIEHGVHLYWVVRGTSSSKNVVPTCNREMIDTSAKNYNSVRHCFKEGCTFKTQWNLRESGKSLPEIQIALNQNLKDMDKLAVYTCQKGLSKQGTIVHPQVSNTSGLFHSPVWRSFYLTRGRVVACNSGIQCLIIVVCPCVFTFK